MELEGIHHVTAITADAQRNVDFYAGVLGLRLVKKTVNQDNPSVYHLFYADEKGDPGSDITFFEYPGRRPGARRRRDDPPDRLAGRLGRGAGLLERAPGRARRRGRAGWRGATALRSATARASSTSWRCPSADDEPLIAKHPEIPAELALQGFDGVCAYASEPDRSRELLGETLGLHSRDEWDAASCGSGGGKRRGSLLRLPRPSRGAGRPGRGHGAPRRLGVARRGARGLARPGHRRRDAADPGDRPLLLPLRLLPGAERRPVRDRHPRRPGLRDRRADREPRREALAAPVHRASAGEIEPNLRPIVNPRQVAA